VGNAGKIYWGGGGVGQDRVGNFAEQGPGALLAKKRDGGGFPLGPRGEKKKKGGGSNWRRKKVPEGRKIGRGHYHEGRELLWGLVSGAKPTVPRLGSGIEINCQGLEKGLLYWVAWEIGIGETTGTWSGSLINWERGLELSALGG